MEEKEQLQKEIRELESQLKPKQERLSELYQDEARAVEAKIRRAHKLQDSFTLDQLIFAATARCECGAGLAYPKGIGMHGSWDCSAILLGHAEKGTTHSPAFPFAYYEIKSDDQPSANGATTRPAQP